MWNKTLAALLTVTAMGTAGSSLSNANEAAGVAVAKYLPSARVTLQDGLRAAETEGQPISGKFEVDGGQLQLSVYTQKDGKFSEILVDDRTGKVAKAEPISQGNDLVDAQRQLEAYGKSRTSLRTAVARAESSYPGYRAVSVTPVVDKGSPVAVVSLLQGYQTRTIAEPLES